MTFPTGTLFGTSARVRRSIQRRAIAIAALQDGLSKDDAAARAGVTRNHMNRWLRPDWKPGL